MRDVSWDQLSFSVKLIWDRRMVHGELRYQERWRWASNLFIISAVPYRRVFRVGGIFRHQILGSPFSSSMLGHGIYVGKVYIL